MRQRTIVEIMVAIATTGRVLAFLDHHAERDEAIRRLVDNIAVGRLALVRELRERLAPHTRAVLSA